MNKNVFGVLSVLVSALALASCNNYNAPATPTPGPPCPVPSGTFLVSPAANATAVPDGTSTIFFSESTALPANNQFQLVVSANTNTALYGAQGSSVPPVQVPATALPANSATPPYANPIYYDVTIPALPGATSFTVFWNDAFTNCSATTSLGTFSTQ
jgi:hypothetical protein